MSAEISAATTNSPVTVTIEGGRRVAKWTVKTANGVDKFVFPTDGYIVAGDISSASRRNGGWLPNGWQSERFPINLEIETIVKWLEHAEQMADKVYADSTRDDLCDLKRTLVTDAFRLAAIFDPSKAETEPTDIVTKNGCGAELRKLRAWFAASGRKNPIESRTEEAIKQESQSRPTEPKRYLLNWQQIIDALPLDGDFKTSKQQVRQLNKRFEGPITFPGQGSQPKVVYDDLLVWWSGLESKFKELEQLQTDRIATTEQQFEYGRDGIVVPGIAGAVKKPRRPKTSKNIEKHP